MVVVHHLENSRSQRILWLLEELGIEYQVKRYDRNKKTNLAPPELFEIHPLGKSPVITDNDLVIAETGAIVEYLIDCYGEGHFKPESGTQAFLRYRYWIHAAEGTFMPFFVMKLVLGMLTGPAVPFFIRPISKKLVGGIHKRFLGPNIKNNLAYMESVLADSEWFAGSELTGADFMMVFVAEAGRARGGVAANYPHIVAWLDKVHAREGYQRALERGGPYQLMGG
jgi:glutathione S-transferase